MKFPTFSFFDKKTKTTTKKIQTSHFDPATFYRPVYSTPVDDDVKPENKSRTRLRNEAHNVRMNPYVEKYISICESIILGADGFILDMNIVNQNNSLDVRASEEIESVIKKWKLSVSACGRFSLRELIALCIREQRIDGEVFLWKQIIDGDLKYSILTSEDIDDDYNNTDKRIANGIKYDNNNRAVTFFRKVDTGREAIPAENIQHIYKAKSAKDFRGITPIAPVLGSLSKLEKFNKASLTQHIIAASNTAAYQKLKGDAEEFGDYNTNDDETPELVDVKDPGRFVKTLNAREIPIVPDGWALEAINLGQSRINSSEFITDVLKEIASGLLIPHHALSSDLAESSYSSLKFNSIFEQSHWASIQTMFVDVYRSIIVDAIKHLIMTKQIKLPSQKINKYIDGITILGYKIPDLEPTKMAGANQINLDLGLTTHTEILSKNNRTVDDILSEKKKEKELEDKYGITLKEATITPTADSDT